MRRLLMPCLFLLATPLLGQNGNAQNSFLGIFATCANMVYAGNGDQAPDLFARCSEIVFALDSESALIAGRDELGAVGRYATEAIVTQAANLASRMAEVRAGASGLSIADLRLENPGEGPRPRTVIAGLGDQRGAGASADGQGERWGLFLNGAVASGDRGAGSEDVAFDFESAGITLGADYRFSDRFFGGIAYGYSGGDNDLTGGGGVLGNGLGELEIDGHSLSLYGSGSLSSSLFLDGSVTVGKTDYDSRTEVSYTVNEVTVATDANGNIVLDENGKIIPIILPGTTTVSQVALSDTEGNQLAASLALGHNLSRGAFTLQSVLLGAYSKLEIDGYDETFSNPDGTGGQLDLQVLDQEVDSLTTAVELTFSYAKSTSWGVFLPQLRVGWTHEFDNDARAVHTRLLSDPNFDNRVTTPPDEGNPLPLENPLGKDLVVFTDEPDRDFGTAGLGFSTVFRNGHQAFLFWDTVFSRGDLTFNAISGGFRFAL